MNFQTEYLSEQYEVRKLADMDVAAVYALCKGNPMYYQYCPPFVTEDSIRADMRALPKGILKVSISGRKTALREPVWKHKMRGTSW